ncbi:ABC transporter substrate-binding protein [Streptacidiphilus sp. N1-3]|uniref:ABC transporter substrate-binding protein n=1 Tax=Streptacidiphilus alkalitolerans TaxID=3342712 RepID=A0ABV6X2S4_9ACTN
MRTHRRRSLGVTALTLLALAAGCAGPPRTGGSGGGPGQGGAAAWNRLSASTPAARGSLSSFTWALYAEPPTLDYISAFDYEQNMVLANVCESLMRWTPQLTEVPGLAERMDRPDPKTFVFQLRPGVRFQDGGTMTADDVVYSLKRQLDPALGSSWGQVFQNVDSISRTGPLQVTVRLKRPDSQFPQYMATAAGVVASAKGVKAAGRDYGTSGGLDCTGPYRLGAWNKGQSLELDRFVGYWGKPAKSAKVVFDFLTDPSALTNALLTGQADGGYLIPSESYTRLRTSGVGTLYFGQGLTTVNLAISNLKGPLGDVRVRRALSMALDRSGFVATGLDGVGSASNALSPRAAWAAAPGPVADAAFAGLPPVSTDRAQNLAAAKALIAQAGATGKTVTVATSPIGQDVSLLATAVQSAGRQIGLDVRLRTIAPDAYTALFSDQKARAGLDMFPETYYLSITDPMDVFANFQTGTFENYGGFSDPGYDQLLEQAGETYDPAARLAIEAKIQQLAAQQVPWIPAAEWPTSLFLDKRITGAPTSIAYMYYPWAADVGAAG